MLLFHIWLFGFVISFLILISDYIILNLRLGYSLENILNEIFEYESMSFFIMISLGSWVTIFMFIFGDKIKK